MQAKKTTNTNVSEQFLKFYNSCVDYQKNFNKSERMKLGNSEKINDSKINHRSNLLWASFFFNSIFCHFAAMEIVNEVGRFEGTHNDFDFTEMLLKLFLRNRWVSVSYIWAREILIGC